MVANNFIELRFISNYSPYLGNISLLLYLKNNAWRR